MKRLLVKNSIFGGLQFALGVLLTLIAVPIFNHVLGSEAYGIFAALTVFNNLNYLAGLGLNVSLIKYLTEQGKTYKSNIDILISCLISLIMVTILIILILCYDDSILRFLNIKSNYYYDAKRLLMLSVFGGALSVLGQVFAAILDALQKVYINNILQSASRIVYWIGIIVVLLIGKGLYEVGLIIFISNVLYFILQVYISLYHWRFFKIRFSALEIKQSAKDQLQYGGKIYASNLLWLSFEPLTKLLMARFAGLIEVGCLDIALRFKGQLWGLFGKILYPVTPYIAAEPNMEKAIRFVDRLERAITLLIIPLIAILWIAMPLLIKVWLHKNAYESILITNATFYITITYLLFNIPIIPLYSLFTIKSKPEYAVYLQIANTVTNFIILILCNHIWPFYATVISISVSVFASYTLAHFLRRKLTAHKIFNYRSIVKLGLLLGLLLLISNGIVFFMGNGYIGVMAALIAIFLCSIILLPRYFTDLFDTPLYMNKLKLSLRKIFIR